MILFGKSVKHKSDESNLHPRKKYAHNASNMDNFLWGAAMHKMGISYRDAMLGSNLHALIKHREFDSRDDQLSIGLGYSYSIRLNQLR